MSFSNVYYKRTTATAKACYVCYKPTTTCLATIKNEDFVYTCPGHLSDAGFASRIGESSDGAGGVRKLGLSKDEIAKVKEEWEERQKRKEEEKETEKEKEQKEKKEIKKEKDKEKEKEIKKEPQNSESKTHERYALHRDFFAMRLAEHRKRRQTAQAKELVPRLPNVPTY